MTQAGCRVEVLGDSMGVAGRGGTAAGRLRGRNMAPTCVK
jgi:hypothetical protein